MKALSPMIATVLLIAFTVAVGGIISTWLTSLSTTATSTTTTVVEKTTLCSNSVLSVKEVTGVFSSTIGDHFNVTIGYDYGSESLYGFNLTFIDNNYNSVTVQPVINKNFNKTYPLKPGQYNVFNINIGNSGNVTTSADLPGSGLARVVVVGMCQDTYPVQAECKASQSCMK